ncbi:hypothetical protein HDV02_000344 [Globomyces sp. JEL0801]|nr:hypothetical protein HDV02_000344 [Globomyces sp. JEL0801]
MTKPCRFFSKGTCNKGDACRFSHQQPNKTILNCGNLIVYGKCEYGSNCIYSHSILSKSENVQTVFGSEQEQKVISYGNPAVEFATLNKPPKTVRIGGITTSAIPKPVPESSNPKALILDIGNTLATFDYLEPNVAKIRNESGLELVHANDVQSFKEKLLQKPKIVLVLGAYRVQHGDVLALLKAYLKECHGTVLFGGLFPSFTNMPNFDKIFAELGCNWRNSSYSRESHSFKAAGATAKYALIGYDFPMHYNIKSLMVSGVATRDCMYLSDKSNVAVAMKRIDSMGYVVYMGDVNSEDDTGLIMLSICQWAATQKLEETKNYVSSITNVHLLPDYDTEDEDSYCSDDESDLEEQRIQNGGFTDEEVNELLCQGVKPWDEDAWAVLNALNGHFY